MLENTGRNNFLGSLFRNLQGIPGVRYVSKFCLSFFSLETFWMWIGHHEILFGHLNPELDSDHGRKKSEAF